MSGESRVWRWTLGLFFVSFSLLLFELVLIRVFAVVLFAAFAHLALALGMLGTTAGALALVAFPGLVPEERAGPRLSLLAAFQGLAAAVSVAIVTRLPLTAASDVAVENYGMRSGVASSLVDPWMLLCAVVALTVPFAVGGAVVAGALKHGRRTAGVLYGGDLLGGAAAGLVLAPLLAWWSAPDLGLMALLLAGLGALCFHPSAPGAVAVVAGCVGLGFGLSREVNPIQYSAGFAETYVVEQRWTALARISVHEGPERTLVLLDNTSASEVVRTMDERAALFSTATARSLVYRLAQPGRVAILASSAGPEVAVAQEAGFSDIDAIDVAGDVADLVLQRFAAAPANPFTKSGVVRITADGRAAIARAPQPYSVIQMVHANLHSAGGLLASAWSPGLLTTEEAFGTYLKHLTPNGLLSFAAASLTPGYAVAAASAVRAQGCAPASDCIAYVDGNQPVVLVRPRPWTDEERSRLVEAVARYPDARVRLLPGSNDTNQRSVLFGTPMVDDRPFWDTPREVWRGVVSPDRADTVATLYRLLIVQAVIVLGVGVVLFLPSLFLLTRQGTRGLGASLFFGATLGYGYLALETVLVHQFVLVVGHPVWAIGAVVGGLMASSGVGSLISGAVPDPVVRRVAWASVGAVILCGVCVPSGLPKLIEAMAPLGAMPVRAAWVAVGVTPLGLAMGMPMALGLRLLGDGRLVPWVWAVNGWTSVVATLCTVVLSRLVGFQLAAVVALTAYAGAAIALRALGDPLRR